MIFGSDPINNIENLSAKNKTKSISIYIVIIFCIITALALLPIVKIDISSQSRGIIKSYKDNVPLTTIVSGKIVWQNLKNNQLVIKGDTLIKISKETLETDKFIQDTLSNTTRSVLNDITNVLKGNYSVLRTANIREDYNKYASKRVEFQSKISQATINYKRNKTLFDKDVIARMEYEKFVFELQFAKQALSSFDKAQKSTWENQRKELTDRIKTINGSIKKIAADSRNYFVLAPTSGTVENFSGMQAG